MSKQVVVVTDSFGSRTEHEGVSEIYVEAGALWLADGDEKTIAVIRSWERAERGEESAPPENADIMAGRDITIKGEAPARGWRDLSRPWQKCFCANPHSCNAPAPLPCVCLTAEQHKASGCDR